MAIVSQKYYRDPAVLERIVEYCGGRNGDACTGTAAFLVVDGETSTGLGIPSAESVGPPPALSHLVSHGKDVFRSMWDTAANLCLLDLDYQNQDYADEALHNPRAAFEKLEAVFQSVRAELARYGIEHISVMTGRGYHFAWQVSHETRATEDIQDLQQLLPTLEGKYLHDHPCTPQSLPLSKGRFHAGMELLTGYLAHKVLRRAYSMSPLPVVTTGLAVGSRMNGRESISIDLSAFGDPLFMRYTRCAFSIYTRPSLPGLTLTCLPRGDRSWQDLMPVRSSLEGSARYAAGTPAVIPQAAAGVARLVREYLRSDLRRYHDYYASGPQDPTETWPSGYDRLDLSSLPPCVAWPLDCPNDALEKPSNIQNVARVLVSRGWHPRYVAGLIRSKFERDYHWGINWLNYDAALRAEFYVRLLFGLVWDGLDDLRDFNCVSHQEKGYCPRPWCGFNLAWYRDPLLEVLKR